MKTSSLGFLRVKVVALAVEDLERADKFYGQTLGLEPAMEGGQQVGFILENTVLMLKPVSDWYGRPSAEPNPRITIQVLNALATEKALGELGVLISDSVQDYDGFLVGAFLDSEGNKLWFCSAPAIATDDKDHGHEVKGKDDLETGSVRPCPLKVHSSC